MFTLRSLLLIVAVAALGTAGLVYRTPYWASAIVTLTLGVFAFGLLRIYSHPEKRRFWIPLSVIGWLYVAIAFSHDLYLRENLPTSHIIYQLWYQQRGNELFGEMDVHQRAFLYRVLMARVGEASAGASEELMMLDELHTMLTVGNCLTALALAFGVGAIYSWSVARKKEGA